MGYLSLKLIHIISSTLLFGTGLGSAFYMFRANQSKDLQAMYFATKNVVIADFLFTTPAVLVQPITGFTMMIKAGFPISSFWIATSLALYVFIGLCWLPVVVIQMKLEKMLKRAIAENGALPDTYYRLYNTWLLLGFPAFISVIVIFYLMVMKV